MKNIVSWSGGKENGIRKHQNESGTRGAVEI